MGQPQADAGGSARAAHLRTHRILVRRRMAMALLAMALVATVSCGGNAAASGDAGRPPQGEQRLLATIVASQRARVSDTTRNAATARDEAAALRLQQRILTDYGRSDLAAALENDAAGKEREARALEQAAADQEAVLSLYVDYAARAGNTAVAAGGTPTRQDLRGPRATRTRPDRVW